MDPKFNDGINQPIVTGQIQNPPKTFTLTIANNDIATIYYDFRFLRILSITNASGVTLRFGMTGQETDVIAAGIGYELEIPVRNAQLRNQSGGSITVVLTVSMGRIYDDRLNVSGTITVQGSVSIVTGTTFTDAANVSVLTTATTQILAANANRKTAIISNLAANATVIKVGTSSAGASRGIEVPIGGTAVLDTTAAIYVYNPSAGTINIGNAEIAA